MRSAQTNMRLDPEIRKKFDILAKREEHSLADKVTIWVRREWEQLDPTVRASLEIQLEETHEPEPVCR